MSFVNHPLIKEGALQSRVYQETMLAEAVKKNVLCVLPTGMGKTPIAIMLVAIMLEKKPKQKILIMAPTKPLVAQHYETFMGKLNIDEGRLVFITGNINPEKRGLIYDEHDIIFATPQTISNDLKTGKLSLKNFSLAVFDEAHHAIGGYAYPFVSKTYFEQSEDPKILALTASPGGTREKIDEICQNLGIEAVEIKTEKDADVREWTQEKKFEWDVVELPPSFRRLHEIIAKSYRNALVKVSAIGFRKPLDYVTKGDLLAMQGRIFGESKSGKKVFWQSFIVARAIKLDHALSLIETQSLKALADYWKKIRTEEKNRASKMILKDPEILRAMQITHEMMEKGYNHPKMGKLLSLVETSIREKPQLKIIIFVSLRSTVKQIVEMLEKVDDIKPVEFIGQKEGMTQKEQLQRLKDFREGKYNTIVATSVGEEGLDIPAMDLAIFYEPVPSEIRSIQRRGRVGRHDVGRVIFLITKGTRDEGYYWASRKKEKVMKRTLHRMKNGDQSEEIFEDEKLEKELKKPKQFRISDFK
ncbi:MAG: DEAD/DEAH box helicase [Candidatus Aenigmarchaeota archaeon]|nr:DEAD/DEAH box helicase [Candidatus Aenigmarchaeota archaeon]